MAESPKSAGWRGAAGSPTSPTAKRSGRGRKFAVILFVMLALAGALGAILYLINPFNDPAFVAVAVSRTTSRLIPPNPFAERDAQTLSNVFKREYAFGQERELLLQKISDLAAVSDRAVVLYVCAYALSDENGKVYLLPGDAVPDVENSRLRLEEVFNRIRTWPAANKLLILDVMRPLADARLGVLANNVAEPVKAAADKAVREDPNLLVLCACAPGQVCLTSEDMGRSVFGFYLEEGLRGAADGHNGQQNTRVSVQELADFLRDRVARWAERHGRPRQTPILVGEANDFDLMAIPQDATFDPEVTAPGEYPQQLLAAWQERDKSWKDERFRLAPWAFRQFEGHLLRAEAQWRGGYDPKQIWSELDKAVTEYRQQLDTARSSIGSATLETRVLRETGVLAKPDPALDELRKTLVTKLNEVIQAAKPSDAAKTAKMEILGKFKETPFEKLAWTAFSIAVDETDHRYDAIQFLHEVLRDTTRPARHIETHFLQRLAGMDAKDWRANTVSRALRVVREGEKAAASDPRVFSWVRGPLEAAAQKRHEGEVFLFSRGYASWEEADKHLDEAAREYDSVNAAIKVVDDAHRACDRALALLPGYVPYLTARAAIDPREDEKRQEDWQAAAQKTIELHGLLANPPAYDDQNRANADTELKRRVSELEQQALSLQTLLQTLRMPFETKNLPTVTGEPTPQHCAELDALLASTWLDGPMRAKVWTDNRRFSAMLHEKTRELDQADNGRRGSSPSGTSSKRDIDKADADRQEQLERQRAIRRATLSITLLKLGGLADESLGKVEKALSAARSQPTKSAAWYALGRELRLTWADRLPAQLEAERNRAVADRLSRVLHPFDEVQTLKNAATNPTVRLRQEETLAMRTWLWDRAVYTAQVLENLGFFEAAFHDALSREYRVGLSNPIAQAFLRIQAKGDAIRLDDSSRSAATALQLTLDGIAPQDARLGDPRAIMPNDQWLDARIERPTNAESQSLPLQVDLRPDATRSSAARPSGFLVQFWLNGRSFYQKVALQLPGPDVVGPKLILSYNARQATDPVSDRLALRPNVQQPVYVFVDNPTAEPRSVIVQLKPETGEPVSSMLNLIPANTRSHRIKWADQPPPADKPPEFKPLGGDTVELRLLDDKMAPLDGKKVRVDVQSPREYVDIRNPLWTPFDSQTNERNKFEVTVQAIGPIVGERCRVDIVFDGVPGLLPGKKEGTSVSLNRAGDQQTLKTPNLRFQRDRNDLNGDVYLTVDKYERAFILRNTFDEQGGARTPERFRLPNITIRSAPFANPEKPYPVSLEVDNAPAGVMIDLGLDRNRDGRFDANEVLHSFREARQEKKTFTHQGPDGALLFKTDVRDWSQDLDLSGNLGTYRLQARMRDRSGSEMKATEKEVTLDATAPEQVRFVQVGKKSVPVLQPGQEAEPLAVPFSALLEVRAQGEEMQSSIEKVLFCLGKPEEGKPLANPKTGTRASDGTWSAKLAIEKPGPHAITVQFMNSVGMPKTETIEILLTDPKAVTGGEAEAPGTIEGKVVEGGNAKAGLIVVLHDNDKKDDKADRKAKTDKNGMFVFKDVPAGSYTVSSQRVSDAGFKRADAKQVQLESGGNEKVVLDLLQ